MKKIRIAFLGALLLCLLAVPVLAVTAYADTDEIVNYEVVAAPLAEDGSLAFTVTLDWKMLESLPDGEELKVGIPNGSIRNATALTENIIRLANDNSYMYIYLDRGYDAGETVHFAYSWVQEYMYTLGEDGSVSYDYTPGWFNDIRVDRMTVTWQETGLPDGEVTFVADDGECWSVEGMTLIGTDLPYGSTVHLYALYSTWPAELSDSGSAAYLPEEYEEDFPYEYEDDSDDGSFVIGIIVFILVVFIVIRLLVRLDRYAGGFGTRYVYVGHLWYPAGPDGRPKPGSVGVAQKPKPPVSSGGLGGGSRGGGFGGGGFGGGSHCACASSCACACACACAGGGRAGCSAKNLYGAVHLDEALTRQLER